MDRTGSLNSFDKIEITSNMSYLAASNEGEDNPDRLHDAVSIMGENDHMEDTVETLDDRKKALSDLFDETFVNVIELLDINEEVTVCSFQYQTLIRRNVGILKELSQEVTDLHIFKKNRTIQMRQSSELKKESYANYEQWHDDTQIESDLEYNMIKLLKLSQVYFEQFIERCKEYEISRSKISIQNLQNASSLHKGVNDQMEEHIKQKDMRRIEIEKLEAILSKILEKNNLCELCHEHSIKRNLNTQDHSTMKVDDAEKRHDLALHDPCVESNVTLPDPETADNFENFILYKYGRGYMKAKIMLDTRNEEKENGALLDYGSLNSKKIIDGNFSKKIQPQTKPYEMHLASMVRPDSDYKVGIEKCSNDGFKNTDSGYSRHESSNSIQSKTLEQANSNPITQNSKAFENQSSEFPFYRYLCYLFTHKCLNEMDICKIQQELVHYLQKGACFRPCYLDHLKFRSQWNGKVLSKEKIIPLRNGGKSYTELNPVTPIEYLKRYANADKVALPGSGVSYTLINPVFSVEMLKTYANADGDHYQQKSESNLVTRESKDHAEQDEVGSDAVESNEEMEVVPNEHGDEMSSDKNSNENIVYRKSSIEVNSKQSGNLEAGDSSGNLRPNETRSEIVCNIWIPRKTRIPIRMKPPCR
ncbi:hypothetical protein WDU94_011711 [Cyamophila willieti]